MGGHDFLDDMPFRMTCVMIACVLREVMLCCRKCFMGSHVLVECISSGWHILQYVVFYRKTCLSGGHVLLECKYYRRACIAVGDVLLGYMFYWRAYHTG